MIGRLNHVAIAVRDIAKASEIYRSTLGAQVSEKVPQPEFLARRLYHFCCGVWIPGSLASARAPE